VTMLQIRPEIENAITVYIPWENSGGTAEAIVSSPVLGGKNGELNKALQTVAVLQTTLELEPLIRLFSREINEVVPHSSVRYENPPHEIDILAGRAAKHLHSYRLIFGKRDLGRVTFTRGKTFTQKESALLKFMFSSLVFPLRNALLYKNVFDASLTDPLTGVFNRAGMEMALRREVSLARRQKTALSLIVLDIDDFKEVNDQHGHEMGDDLLRLVVDSVTKCLRGSDIVSRYGGDEFTILLSNTNRKGAVILAQHIRRAIQDAQITHNGDTIGVTVCMGVASINRRTKDNDLFARADEALYEAKKSGSNSIKIAH
jgi:diguanylate cyclase (GGDEF)-like protein